MLFCITFEIVILYVEQSKLILYGLKLEIIIVFPCVEWVYGVFMFQFLDELMNN